MENKLRVIELFGGIGAFSKALERLNIPHEIVDYVEIDKHAVNSYNAVHGTNFEPQDITKWDKDIEIDMIMHGSPCTNFSLAGKQEGGDEGTNTASSLMYETLRIVDKVRPRYVIWENVPNLLSDEHKPNFDNYLKIMKEFGYKNYYKVLDASDFGIPQGRKRVFTLSILGDEKFTFPEPRILKCSYNDFLESNYDVEQVVLTEHDLKQVKGFGANHSYGGRVVNGNVYPTITASYGKASGNSGKIKCKEGYRILTAKECWRLMGFDDEDYENAAKVSTRKELYKQAGNSIVVNVLEAILSSLFQKDENPKYIYNYNKNIDNVIKALLQPKKNDENGNGNANVNF